MFIKIKKNIWLLLLVLPILLVYSKIFSLKPLIGGDAPNFSSQEINEFFAEPYVWTHRGENFGGVDPRIYISPLLFLYSLAHRVLGFDHEILVRLFFYIPSLFLSFLGSYQVSRHFKLSKTSSSLAAFFYSLNTYLILLMDGGQVGILLAYGLFPFVYFNLKNYNEKLNANQFVKTLILLTIITISDPRIAMVAILLWVFSILSGNKSRLFEKIKHIFLLLLAWAGVNMYWIYPLVKIPQTSGSLSQIDFNFLSLINGLTFYQPHWPENIFGRIVWPEWIFLFITAIVLFGVFVKSSKEKTVNFLTYLVFVFLLKGANFPLGGVYERIINLPLGSAFRDSSKFFVPVMLLGAVLVGSGLDTINKVNKKYFFPAVVFFTMLLLAIASPTYLGKMNFALGNNIYSKNIDDINSKLSNDNSFTRTVWIPERHPQTLELEKSQAIDGKSLAEMRPLAGLTAGSSDKFNYIYQGDEFLDWYRLMGIKYIVTSGDTRNPNPNQKETDEWNSLIHRLDSIQSLDKLGSNLYRLDDQYPNIYFVPHIYAVVGSFINDTSPDYAYIYFEDGKLDPELLNGIDAESLTILFNGKDENDLLMSLLKNYFVGPDSAVKKEWAYFASNDYLLGKYQLLIRDLPYSEFDYELGFLMSDNRNEAVKFSLKAPADEDYVLAVRAIGNVSVDFNNESESYKFGDDYGWYTRGVQLPKGKYDLELKNQGGLGVINTVALIPADEYNQAQETQKVFVEHFGTVDQLDHLVTENSSPETLNISRKYHYFYDIPDTKKSGFLVFTDTYHPLWNLKRGQEYFEPLPVYSEFNTFYIDDSWSDLHLEFRGQKIFRKGVYFTTVTILGLVIIYLYKMSKN